MKREEKEILKLLFLSAKNKRKELLDGGNFFKAEMKKIFMDEFVRTLDDLGYNIFANELMKLWD